MSTIKQTLLRLSEENPSALFPLKVNPKTGEPFLALPAPHSNIIITPPRLDTDPADIVPILNDPKVHLFLPGVPYPHTIGHARNFLETCNVECEKALHELIELTNSEEADAGVGKEGLVERRRGPTGLPLVSACPVRILREVQNDGTDVYIGDIGCTRSNFFHILDPEEAQRLAGVNKKRELGDPEIVWSIGDYLASPYHGRGIMTAAVRTLIHDWIVPRLGARRIIVTAAPTSNIASVRVFEKNGFKLVETTQDIREMPKSNGGGKFGMHVLQWTAEPQTESTRLDRLVPLGAQFC